MLRDGNPESRANKHTRTDWSCILEINFLGHKITGTVRQ
jgi:hypothetical protein